MYPSDWDSDIYSSSDDEEYGSSGNEADSEGEDGENMRDMDYIINKFKTFNPYLYEPEKEVSSTSESESLSSPSEDESEYETCSEGRSGSLDWCECWGCQIETREIDCLCCLEVAALNEKLDEGDFECIVDSPKFSKMCLDEDILGNVLTGLHETRGDHLEEIPSNRSLRYAAYRQFSWWAFNRLGKNNRRVLPSCILWKIRNTFPDPDGQYTKYKEGEKD